MVHVLEHSQLSVSPLGVDGRLEGPGELLYGHLAEGAVLLPQLGVGGRADLKEANGV